MGSLGTPKTWVPYLNNKDCSQGFCSLYCPMWCYIIYPPPPPPPHFPGGAGGGGPSRSLSPFVVAIIGILASAVLLVSYYTIISKYCGRERRSSSSSSSASFAGENRSSYADDEPALHEAWHVATTGLDEAAIKAIAVREYKRGDGVVEGTDCSVCLSEFEEGESVRLLPKCSHAFHIHCIDAWLRSHSNCPLCRAAVAVPSVAPPESSFSHDTAAPSEDVPAGQNSSFRADREAEIAAPKSADSSSSRAFSDSEERRAVRDEIRRSVSMDFSPVNRVSVADILRTSCGCEEEECEECVDVEAGCSKFVNGNVNDCGHRRKEILLSVKSPVAMKRSVSSGRFFLRRNTTVLPL